MTEELWGAETRKAIANFPVSGEPIPHDVARWLGRIKAAAARVNAELGLLDAEKAERIAVAADRIANGELEDLLRERDVEFVEYAGWEAIDAHEKERGEPHGRPRVKLHSWDELLARGRPN